MRLKAGDEIFQPLDRGFTFHPFPESIQILHFMAVSPDAVDAGSQTAGFCL